MNIPDDLLDIATKHIADIAVRCSQADAAQNVNLELIASKAREALAYLIGIEESGRLIAVRGEFLPREFGG